MKGGHRGSDQKEIINRAREVCDQPNGKPSTGVEKAMFGSDSARKVVYATETFLQFKFLAIEHGCVLSYNRHIPDTSAHWFRPDRTHMPCKRIVV